MKILPRTVLMLYLLTLLWLVLFKFSFDVSGVLLEHQSRSLNLIPFAGYSPDNAREMFDNLIAFIPIGLLLSASFKRVALWWKFAILGAFSVVVEAIQFICAIGVADVTDVILNASGGLLGLLLYAMSTRHSDDTRKQDQWIVTTCMALLMAAILLRVFVFKVRY